MDAPQSRRKHEALAGGTTAGDATASSAAMFHESDLQIANSNLPHHPQHKSPTPPPTAAAILAP
jgi:hypothetical protein